MGQVAVARASTRGRGDEGFTLVEAIVSLMVLGIIFSALATAAIGALRASWTSRTEQQGIDFATQALERARDLDYGALAHVSGDLASDPRITSCGSNKCFKPDPARPEEVLLVSASGGVNPHITQVSAAQSNKVPISVATYVTDPQEHDAEYKRVTVVASWTLGGVQRQRVVSSLVTETTRGLPLPIFKLTPLGGTSVSLNGGADAVLGFTLANQGAPDRWNLTFAGASAGSWSLYRDDGDGVWEGSTTDLALTNTNSSEDALVDTGRIDPTGSMVFWAVRTVPVGTAAGDYWSTLTATSAAQPTAQTATASLDLLVRVVDGAVVSDPGGGQVTTVPGAPVGLLVGSGNGSLTASWNAPASPGSSAITDYVVSYKVSGTGTWAVFADGISTATTATITGLTNNTTYDVGIAAKNSAGVGALASAQGMPQAPYSYTAPITCPATPLAPSANNGYTMRTYSLHNRSSANPSWPGVGVPAATSTVGQGLPLVAAIDGAQVPAGTDLPVYSSDILPSEPGRVLLAGGSLTSSDTTRVVDWRATIGSKSYKGNAVLMLWVAPVSIDDQTLPWSLTAQPYYKKSDGTLVSMDPATTVVGNANSFGTLGCLGWRQVYFRWNVNQANALGATEYLGVRMWVPNQSGNMARLRVAFDVAGDFPAGFTVPEKP